MFSPRLFIEWDERGRLVFIPAEIMEMKTTHLLLCSEFFYEGFRFCFRYLFRRLCLVPSGLTAVFLHRG